MSIVIENLCHVYGKGTPFLVEALKDVSLEIEKGQLTGIIGHTGSGKSTLAQHLNGLEQSQSGRVMVDNVELSGKYDKKAIRTKVGMVFQYPEQQLFEETVVKDICFGPKNLGLSEEQQIERAKSAMALMQIEYETFAERSPFDLSRRTKKKSRHRRGFGDGAGLSGVGRADSRPRPGSAEEPFDDHSQSAGTNRNGCTDGIPFYGRYGHVCGQAGCDAPGEIGALWNTGRDFFS